MTVATEPQTSTANGDSRRCDEIARKLSEMIDAGVLRSSDRVPSVRQTAKQSKVAIGTVLHAYRLLERSGRIAARPQSGYFVRDVARTLPEPQPSVPPSKPGRPSMGQLSVRMGEIVGVPGVVPLGRAVPSPEVLPTQQLNRIAAAIGRKTGRGFDAYDIPPGCLELRIQIARHYLEAGCVMSPDDIITTCGCQEALALCLRAVARPGGIVAIDSPAYYGHLQTIEMLGMKALELPTDPRIGVDLDALRRTLANKKIVAVLLVTNVHNPLGFVMADDRKRQLADLIAEFDVPLIEDDTYGDLTFAPERPGVCKSHDTAGRVMLCGSFSKTLAPGARVGWCAPGRYAEAVKRLKFCSTVATSTLPQLAIADFLAGGGYKRHLRKMRATYEHRVRFVADAVQRYFPAGTRASRPVGGHVLWVELPAETDAVRLFEAAAAEKISIAPGPLFSASGGFRNCLRLNCSYPTDGRLEQAIVTLGRLAGEAAGPLL